LVPREIREARLRSRTGDVSDADAVLMDEQERAWEGFTDAERSAVLSLNTTGPADVVAEEVVNHLDLSPSII
jgi:predicted kinase